MELVGLIEPLSYLASIEARIHPHSVPCPSAQTARMHAMRLILHPPTIGAGFQAYVTEPACGCTLIDIPHLLRRSAQQLIGSGQTLQPFALYLLSCSGP